MVCSLTCLETGGQVPLPALPPDPGREVALGESRVWGQSGPEQTCSAGLGKEAVQMLEATDQTFIPVKGDVRLTSLFWESDAPLGVAL